MRPVPAHWRSEILQAARAASGAERPTVQARRRSQWRELFWPSPFAWAGGAAAWLLILALTLAARPDPEERRLARSAPPPNSTFEFVLAERQLLLTRFPDGSVPPPANPPRDVDRPRPRSERIPHYRCA